jgi:mono/diheme cytochrome c family protein
LLEKASTPRERQGVLTAAALAVPNDGLAKGLWKVLGEKTPQDGTVVEAAKLALRRQGTTLLTVALAGESLPGGWLGGEVEEITRRVANGPNRAALEPIVAAANPALGDRFSRILEEAPVQKPAEEKLPEHLVAGRDAYMKSCVECHQADGKGVENTFPPLAGSEWVSGDPRTLLRIMLGGLMGPITVKGVEYDSVMPGHSHAPDEEIAAVASYVRYAFGDKREKAVDPKYVKELRPEVEKRQYRPWTVKELSEVKGQ